GNHDVDDGGEPQGEREALDVADGEEVQDHRCNKRHEVTGDDRPTSPIPRARHGGTERRTTEDLVLDALEVHHEGVCGGADADDQTRNAGQVQAITDPAAQQDQETEDRSHAGYQRDNGDQAESSVVPERVEGGEHKPNEPGNQPSAQGSLTHGWRDRRRGTTRLAVLADEAQW